MSLIDFNTVTLVKLDKAVKKILGMATLKNKRYNLITAY